MTEPRLPSCCSFSLQGRGRNDKSYLQVTVGNSRNSTLGKKDLFSFLNFVFFDGRVICDAARWTVALCSAVLSDNLRGDWSAFRDFDCAIFCRLCLAFVFLKRKQDTSPAWHVLSGKQIMPQYIRNMLQLFRRLLKLSLYKTRGQPPPPSNMDTVFWAKADWPVSKDFTFMSKSGWE